MLLEALRKERISSVSLAVLLLKERCQDLIGWMVWKWRWRRGRLRFWWRGGAAGFAGGVGSGFGCCCSDVGCCCVGAAAVLLVEAVAVLLEALRKERISSVSWAVLLLKE